MRRACPYADVWRWFDFVYVFFAPCSHVFERWTAAGIFSLEHGLRVGASLQTVVTATCYSQQAAAGLLVLLHPNTLYAGVRTYEKFTLSRTVSHHAHTSRHPRIE